MRACALITFSGLILKFKLEAVRRSCFSRPSFCLFLSFFLIRQRKADGGVLTLKIKLTVKRFVSIVVREAESGNGRNATYNLNKRVSVSNS